VILGGCGEFDGTNVHEAVCCLISLSKNNVIYDCYSVSNMKIKSSGDNPTQHSILFTL